MIVFTAVLFGYQDYAIFINVLTIFINNYS